MKTNNLMHAINYVYKHKFHSAEVTKIFGFWTYLMSDCVFFCCLFATYAILVNNSAGGPSNKNLFELTYVLLETFFLLASSIAYEIAILAMYEDDTNKIICWIGLAWFLGICFLGMELYEFYSLIAKGFGPNRSASLSAFFALTCTHSFHVISGLIWMLVLIFLIFFRGLTNVNRTRIMCLSLFWHFLDIIWICVFSIVYLIGSIR